MAAMKFSILMAAGIPLVSPLMAAGVKSGHAEAELIANTASYKPGAALTVGVRLKVDEGWHSYWVNPGVGGMPLKVVWTLPEGWQAGELRQPVPKKFKTGDLPGFGYEGEAIFLVEMTPPAGADGEVELKAKVSWLTCDDSACVPGDAELSLKLPAGAGTPGGEVAAIFQAAKKIPMTMEGAELTVGEAGDTLTLRLKTPAAVDLQGSVVYPATPEVVDPAAPIVFKRTKTEWVATVKKNEYAEGPPTLLDIVLVGGMLEKPYAVSWRAKE
jgi:DsbC/DsbD-like thiol-disulfide interchange protein